MWSTAAADQQQRQRQRRTAKPQHWTLHSAMIFVRQIADPQRLPHSVRSRSVSSHLVPIRKTASHTVFSIRHSEQCFIPPLITGPQGKHAAAPVSNLETNPHRFSLAA